MPDKAIVPVFDQCTSCAFASLNGPVYGSVAASHTEICCLYKFARLVQSPLCSKELGPKPTGTCDGLCKDCPSRLKFRQLQDNLFHELPHRSGDLAQEGIADTPTKCPAAPGKPKYTKISPRRRRGFKKLTIELRPPKFKKKLWFGTYEPEEVARATDAINFYMGVQDSFILPDSPEIFSRCQLGIEYQDLLPSCDQLVQVGQKQVPASVYFARRVKEVIKTVTRKKKGPLKRKSPKCKAQTGTSCTSRTQSEKMQSLLSEATQKMGISEPGMTSASGSTSSTIIPCASGSTSSSIIPCGSTWTSSSTMGCASGSTNSSADEVAWDASNVACSASSEADPEPVPMSPSFLPSPEMLMSEEENYLFSEFFRLHCDDEMFPSTGYTFSTSPSVAALMGDGENGMMEDNGFPDLWS